jgi:hypothetical protein
MEEYIKQVISSLSLSLSGDTISSEINLDSYHGSGRNLPFRI